MDGNGGWQPAETDRLAVWQMRRSCGNPSGDGTNDQRPEDVWERSTRDG